MLFMLTHSSRERRISQSDLQQMYAHLAVRQVYGTLSAMAAIWLLLDWIIEQRTLFFVSPSCCRAAVDVFD